MSRIIKSKGGLPGKLRHVFLWCVCTAAALHAGGALAALSQTPLFVAQPPQPNIMFTLDNSGSMAWSTVTGLDGTAAYASHGTTNKAYYSSDYNGIYYDPKITYTPGVTYEGVSMGNSNVAAALSDPYPTGGTGTTKINETCYIATAQPSDPMSSCGTQTGTRKYQIAKYAFHYKWNGTTNIKRSDPSNSAFPDRIDILPGASYDKAPSRTDCGSGSSCSYDQEIQNFANWHTYYSTRILMMKTAIGLAFAPIDKIESPANPPKYRVGFNTINAPGTTNSNAATTDGLGWLTIREFDATQKQTFYTKLYAINPNGGTPLRAQMDRIGKLYDGSLTTFSTTKPDPYWLSPTDKTMVSCRPSYHIMSTDGYWNGGSGSFSDSDSLAKIAKHYYETDLRPTLANNVKPTNTRDTATHQHMTTFTIGLGADGEKTFDPDYETATPAYTWDSQGGTAWPVAKADKPSTTDDLWRAAIGGKGRYFSAKTPGEMTDGLVKVLKDISIQAGAAATAATTGSQTETNAFVYVPGFVAGKWIGQLKAYKRTTSGTATTEDWNAATKLPAASARNIATWNPDTSAGAIFEWATLTTTQKAALPSAYGASDTGKIDSVLQYLRGDATYEKSEIGAGTGKYRYREGKLGDIVNSAPLYVKTSDFGLQVLPGTTSGASTYRTFVAGKASRTPMLYVGANDGMLHAFNAETGIEKFAFVPNAVYPGLVSLSSPDYGHQYYVDGLMTQGDAYLGAWKTILLGSVGAGGRSVFAIDITDPTALGASKVMWEKEGTATGDFAGLGRVLGQVTVVRLRNNKWGAIFGNGYDSVMGTAMLYVLDLSTGALIKSIEVASTVTGNGLGAPALVFNAQRELVGAYAGDLKGNLWKFDLSSDLTSAWSGSKLFSAVNAAGNVQAMVKRPALEEHPSGGYMVTVATGKFIEASDKTNVDVQSLYGIWDKPGASAVSGRTILIQQTLTAATGGRTLTANTVDWATKRGWYVDLSLKTGERVIGDLQILNNAVLMATTLAPVNDMCKAGGDSQQMGIDFLTGGARKGVLFTVNGVAMTGLSSIDIAGTAAGAGFASSGHGKYDGIVTKLDGDTTNPTQGFEVDTGTSPFRTWHQLPIK